MRLSPYLVATMIFLLVGCGGSNQPSTQSDAAASPASLSNRIYAVSYPLQFLTQEITGEGIEVLVPFDNSSDPRVSLPTREVVELMQKSDLVITNGIGARYAKWMVVVSLPQSKIINTASRGLAIKEYIAIKGESVVHSHGPQGEHSHPVMAARTWLDPALAKKQANYIAGQLKKTYPEKADQFEANLGRLQSRLDELVASMKQLDQLDDLKSPMVLTAGSRLEFFIRAAGFSGERLTGFLKDNELTGPQLVDSIESQLKTLQGAQDDKNESPELVLFDSASLADERFQKLFSAAGIQAVEIELLDHAPYTGDYLSVMKANIARVAEALQH